MDSFILVQCCFYKNTINFFMWGLMSVVNNGLKGRKGGEGGVGRGLFIYIIHFFEK